MLFKKLMGVRGEFAKVAGANARVDTKSLLNRLYCPFSLRHCRRLYEVPKTKLVSANESMQMLTIVRMQTSLLSIHVVPIYMFRFIPNAKRRCTQKPIFDILHSFYLHPSKSKICNRWSMCDYFHV